MKLINSKVEIIPQEPGLLGVYKQIELGGRTAYKSEDRITEDSAKAFVDMLIGRGHTAPLEQGTIYLKITYDVSARGSYLDSGIENYVTNPYSKVVFDNGCDYRTAYITTNARVIYEHGWQDDLKYLCEPTKYHERRITARFTCSRSIGNELVRHRTFSFVQESTRYCNYSKDKFNNNLTFIIPTWSNLPEGQYNDLRYDYCIDRTIIAIDCANYSFEECDHLPKNNRLDNINYELIESYYTAEQDYLVSVNSRGLTPQQAREMLPLGLKTEVVMTGFESDWVEFFKLRCDVAAHPDMQKLANELKQKMSDAAK